MEPGRQRSGGGGAGGHLASAWRGAAIGLSCIATLTASPVASRAAPRDPDQLPYLPAPNGQPRRIEQRWTPPTVSGRSARRRVAVSLVPTFASFFRARFLGRPDKPTAGVGATLETDVHLVDPVWLRFIVSHSVHPVNDEYTRDDDDNPVKTAAKGLVQATHAGLGIAYGIDLGRVLPLAEVGVGALWLRSPSAVQDGQLGGACTGAGACDTGLLCGGDDMCHVATSFAAHGGLGLDVLLGDHFSAGAAIRYFALVASPGVFPVYLTVGLRLGARF